MHEDGYDGCRSEWTCFAERNDGELMLCSSGTLDPPKELRFRIWRRAERIATSASVRFSLRTTRAFELTSFAEPGQVGSFVELGEGESWEGGITLAFSD